MKVKVKVKQDMVIMYCCNGTFLTEFPAGYIKECPFCQRKKPSYYVSKL